MKKFITLLLPLLLFSCYYGEILTEHEVEEPVFLPRPPVNPSVGGSAGTVSFSMPSSTSRKFDATTVEDISNVFEFIIYNHEVAYTVSSESLSATKKVPVGTFKIIALAGYKIYPSNKNVVLLAAAKKENVVIEKNKATNVALNLKKLDFDFLVPEEIDTGEPYDVKVTGNTQVAGLLFPRTLRVDRYNLNDDFHDEFTVISDTEQQAFNLIKTSTAPNYTMSYKHQLEDIEKYVLRDDNGWELELKFQPLDYSWCTPVFSLMPESTHSEMIKTVKFKGDEGDADVTLTW